jgi:hypothetical protein
MSLAQPVGVSAAGALLPGELVLPPDARGLVLLPHGRGTGRGPLDAGVAEHLRPARLGTLLLSLLTPQEEGLDARTAAFRFDLGLQLVRVPGTPPLAGQPGAADEIARRAVDWFTTFMTGRK